MPAITKRILRLSGAILLLSGTYANSATAGAGSVQERAAFANCDVSKHPILNTLPPADLDTGREANSTGTRTGEDKAEHPRLSNREILRALAKVGFNPHYYSNREAEQKLLGGRLYQDNRRHDKALNPLHGLNENEILEILGEPEVRKSYDRGATWLYHVGYSQETLLVAFKNGRCTEPENENNNSFFQTWHYYAPYWCDYPLHPFLEKPPSNHLYEYHTFDSVPFSADTVKKLMHLNFNPLYGDKEELELKAAEQFCRLATGKTPAQIQQLAGEPIRYSETNGSKRWIYFLGYNKVPLGLVFDNNTCSQALIIAPEQELKNHTRSDFSFTNPILSQQKNKHEGETQAQKLPDFKALSQLSFNPYYFGVEAAEETAADQFARAAEGLALGQIKALAGEPVVLPASTGNAVLLYNFGFNRIPVRLLMKHNHCVYAQVMVPETEAEKQKLCAYQRDEIYGRRRFQHLDGEALPTDFFAKQAQIKPLKYGEMIAAILHSPDYGKVHADSWYPSVAEHDAATRLCQLLPNKSSADVLALTGPKFTVKVGQFVLWPDTPEGQINWLLHFRRAPLRLKFENDKCLAAMVLSNAEDTDFWRRRLDCFQKGKVIGMSASELIKCYGEPDKRGPSKESGDTLFYFLDARSTIELSLENDKCTEMKCMVECR
jgi:hypothetical protein